MFTKIFSEHRAFRDINLKKYGTARQATDDNVIWHMRVAWWITKTTDTHSEYVILFAFPLQQRICERAPMLSCTYNAYLVCINLHVNAYKGDGLAPLLSKCPLVRK
jgi:hypothetical protein